MSRLKEVWENFKELFENEVFTLALRIFFIFTIGIASFTLGRLYEALKYGRQLENYINNYNELRREFDYYKEHSYTLSSYDRDLYEK